MKVFNVQFMGRVIGVIARNAAEALRLRDQELVRKEFS